MVVASLQHALSQAGFHVLVATDGREASLCREHIDLLITDLQMPAMSGQELARRRAGAFPSLPIVFITGDPDAQPFPTEAEFPNHVLLHKPFLPSELICAVAEIGLAPL